MAMNTEDHACRVCASMSAPLFSGVLLNLSVDYYQCQHCGYVQTENPYWLERAYSDAINDSDTGIMARNQSNARVVLSTLFLLGKLGGRVVDYAGGYGILVRMLRDCGVDAVWSDRYCQNLLAKGFEHQGEKADLVTAFEAFEHFVHPQQELDKILEISPNILLSTEIIPDPAPRQDDWWYYGKDHGQHIGFFRVHTLEKMAKHHGKKLISDGQSYHLITDQNINPTYWKMVRLLTRLSPKLVSWKLKSKIWDDHNRMAKAKVDR